tara:strand:- start:224 stop:454 length:231 start_codon:yes stop_codon:yes gene_type:complete
VQKAVEEAEVADHLRLQVKMEATQYFQLLLLKVAVVVALGVVTTLKVMTTDTRRVVLEDQAVVEQIVLATAVVVDT